MTKFKWYRWLRVVFFGDRSFSKDENGTKFYLLISGNADRIIPEVERLGLKEEWGSGN
jgi:hypothetical protein